MPSKRSLKDSRTSNGEQNPQNKFYQKKFEIFERFTEFFLQNIRRKQS